MSRMWSSNLKQKINHSIALSEVKQTFCFVGKKERLEPINLYTMLLYISKTFHVIYLNLVAHPTTDNLMRKYIKCMFLLKKICINWNLDVEVHGEKREKKKKTVGVWRSHPWKKEKFTLNRLPENTFYMFKNIYKRSTEFHSVEFKCFIF